MTAAKVGQGMKAPAYQEYAANMLADINFRSLGLAERGLLYTLRLECWVNGRMPSRAAKLAKALGLQEDEIARGLKELTPFFSDTAGMLSCQSLEDYRAAHLERRTRQSAGGKKGAATTNKKWASADDHAPSMMPTSVVLHSVWNLSDCWRA